MTIGPEPMRRIFLMSVRFGTARSILLARTIRGHESRRVSQPVHCREACKIPRRYHCNRRATRGGISVADLAESERGFQPASMDHDDRRREVPLCGSVASNV